MTIKEKIKSDLANMSKGDFLESMRQLLSTLGYRSQKTFPHSGLPSEFFPQISDTITRRNLFRQVKSLRLVFQLTNKEISNVKDLFENDNVDESEVDSFYFVTAELKSGKYSRTKYAEMTREINKRYDKSPAAVFFRVEDLLTVAFISRRPHKHDSERDVLGKVTLIKDICLNNPHRAHLDILSELSLMRCFAWIDTNKKSQNFSGLLAAWIVKLDTEELNKQFYKKLFEWFERAVKECKFPGKESKILSPQEHAIRLITRMLFIWFIKEKGLIAEELFNEEQFKKLLKNYDREKGDSYYRTVLQNLFFATLNTEIGKRGFSKGTNETHRDFSRYRYKDEMNDPCELLELFAQTPFINGGLFDCLDSFDGTKAGGYRIDCFSEKHQKLLSIPNYLFFDKNGLITLFKHYKFTVEENTPAEQEIALDPELLGKVFENLLAAYNPETRETVRKKTGSYYTPRAVVDYMVDEALTAYLMEKTQPDDGNQTFWQKRLHHLLDYTFAINDANELFSDTERNAIVRSITEIKALDPAVGSGAFPMSILHKLTLALRRLDPGNQLWEAIQTEKAKLRAGAAFDTTNRQERNNELKEISDIFERYRDSDFGRKLYLIQNSIFGVDIQPIACQIAKLRFFISLAIEQELDNDADNYGIKPLPNLETRFVAANTLISLNLSEIRSLLEDNTIRKSLKQIKSIREKYFLASTRQQKIHYINQEEQCRKQLKETLEFQEKKWTEMEQKRIDKMVSQFPNEEHRKKQREKCLRDYEENKKKFNANLEDAQKIVRWDSLQQNSKADWFDAEYMFGCSGFDIIIGNPPYIQLQKNGSELGNLYQHRGFQTFTKKGDIYQLFYEKGCKLLKEGQGFLVYITSNSWLRADYGKTLRSYISENYTPVKLLEMGPDIFENVTVDTSILFLMQGRHKKTLKAIDMNRPPSKDFPPDNKEWIQIFSLGEKPWSILSSIERSIKNKMESKGKPLKEWDISIYRGVLTGCNDAFIIDNETKEALIADSAKSEEIIRPIVRGRDIKRYKYQWNRLHLIATFPSLSLNIENYPAIKKHLLAYGKKKLEQIGKNLPDGTKTRKKTPYEWFELQDTCAYHTEFEKEKLVWIELVNRGRFSYDNSGIYCEATSFIMTGRSLKYLVAMLNSTLICWFLQQNAPTSGMRTLRWKKIYVETIPIPQISEKAYKTLVELTNKILSAKVANPETDIDYLESEIDSFVYGLYGLNSEEIAFVQRYKNNL